MSTHTQGQNSDSLLGDLLRIVLALFLPPIAVLLEVGLTKHFFLNIILTLLGFLPGLIHAVWVVARR
ncbi:YqaE/Pmp3 family membrane protein [Roseospira visakhapatnamensis]|uniref:Uncharacterized membrane protein YqaE (UPF0057 family) n=1 Tax=Roseospira visakhapatnamensis TaxID=390880 RepID=A0A7W6W998_9PROT|nr:YqaE/Pmp3 family membrane protein [Roseospira visakhapatnamensis]MBB4265880.1 uncharacterized membrane protein YqaE (UPF0057 family) [Roseospira visakhapatnamensis]